MAWRIDEAVIRGEIDNCTRGRVIGRIWFEGRAEPVELDLAGNAWRDLAGRRLAFTNPQPKAGGDLDRFAMRQTGVIGDCTASRKVKVPDIPMDQIGEYYAAKKKWTWHWGNSLYLEWFSATNGRVVIESASFQLVVAPEIAWEMTPVEEEQQRRANAAAMENFMERLGDAVAGEQARETGAPAEGRAVEKTQEGSAAEEAVEADEPWQNDRPLTEAEADRMHEESERLVDRIQARIEREGESADFEKILEEELERRRIERGEKPLTPEQESERDARLEEMNRAAEEAANDPERDAELDRKHPLAERAFEFALRLMKEPEERGWVSEDAGEEHPLVDLAAATSKASVKLAGALNGEDWPPPVEFCATHLVRLKTARGYLDDALRAAEACLQQNLGERRWIEEAQRELTALAHDCDSLIGELRAQLERGFD